MKANYLMMHPVYPVHVCFMYMSYENHQSYSLEKGVWLSPVRPYEYCRPIDEMPGEYRKKSS